MLGSDDDEGRGAIEAAFAPGAVDGDNNLLSPTTILSLAIVLHELATNAMKYGAFSNDEGTIAVDWHRALRDRLILRWAEQHGPAVTAAAHKGFGSWVSEHGLAHELGGKVTQEYAPEGLRCTIDMPAPALTGR